jgi:hypothetical protein
MNKVYICTVHFFLLRLGKGNKVNAAVNKSASYAKTLFHKKKP